MCNELLKAVLIQEEKHQRSAGLEADALNIRDVSLAQDAVLVKKAVHGNTNGDSPCPGGRQKRLCF